MALRASLARAIRPPAVESEVAALYRAHFGYVWQALRTLGVESAVVEDAVHDVFVVAHRRWRDFEGRSTARTWLFGIARRIAHRHRRTQHRTQRRRAALALVRPPEPIEPDAVVAHKEAWQALWSFLDALPVEHREAFVLGELEGASRQQMGQALGISPNTAYSRLRAARRRFVEAFPQPQRRHAVASARAPAPRDARPRIWALVMAHPAVIASRPLGLAGVLGSAGIAAALGGGVVLALKVALASASGPSARPPASAGPVVEVTSGRLRAEGTPQSGAGSE
ncbi:MAG: sigma-70 family RNA polymerase sigma factor, partial [Myxococcales bacterium]|nr:sigma-70 family RNA polymerase sigma factor [Myxococcales bacterium]